MHPLASRELFIGLMPDEAVRDAIRRHAAGWKLPSGGWRVPASGYHLSVAPVDQNVAALHEAGVRAELRRVAMEPLDLVLEIPGAWQKNSVLQPAPHDGLRALRDRIAARLRARRAFTPHVTLAYHATKAAPPTDAVAIPWAVREFVLMQFDDEAGAYQVRERFPVNTDRVPPPPRGPVQGDLFDTD